MKKSIIMVSLCVVCILFVSCNKTKDCQHKFDDNIPAVSDDTYNSCMSVVKQYTHAICEHNYLEYPYPYENEIGKKQIKVVGYVTDVGHIPGMSYRGNPKVVLNSFYLADDTINSISPTRDDQWYQKYKTLQIRVGLIDKTRYSKSKGISDTVWDNVDVMPNTEQGEAFISKCRPIFYDFKQHINKKCYLTGTLGIFELDGPFQTMVPVIFIMDTTDYYFE